MFLQSYWCLWHSRIFQCNLNLLFLPSVLFKKFCFSYSTPMLAGKNDIRSIAINLVLQKFSGNMFVKPQKPPTTEPILHTPGYITSFRSNSPKTSHALYATRGGKHTERSPIKIRTYFISLMPGRIPFSLKLFTIQLQSFRPPHNA